MRPLRRARRRPELMSSVTAPNVSGVGAPGRRTVYSMCGMCAVRCPMEVTVEDGRVTWLQGNPHDKAIGASLCAKGSAGLAFEYATTAAADAADPQRPARRRPVAAGVLGRGSRLHRRQAARDDRGLRRARHRALRSRRPLQRPDPDLRAGARLAELLQPRRRLRRQRPQRRALDLRLRPRGAHPRPGAREAPRALRPQHRRVADGQGGQGLHGRGGERDARHLHRSARHASPPARRPATGRCARTATTR